jgi:acyl-coenzyme A synthetase/AMP-(fatty) acid ligase
VQVHGYRVELSEIEKQLSMHKDIREVVFFSKAY